ncbi:hypothetical protein ADUPG1_011098 [Aduncisulcus paluster]|uniref:Uncharacterized protein n=1 Tax=Aduncisulcus paluster TaxID=2918883 RepID=A0ABQ5JUA1_9EUKA|nr:hypothetical protein ADUPG1_011098 [Aduncisulcus paluster]
MGKDYNCVTNNDFFLSIKRQISKANEFFKDFQTYKVPPQDGKLNISACSKFCKRLEEHGPTHNPEIDPSLTKFFSRIAYILAKGYYSDISAVISYSKACCLINNDFYNELFAQITKIMKGCRVKDIICALRAHHMSDQQSPTRKVKKSTTDDSLLVGTPEELCEVMRRRYYLHRLVASLVLNKVFDESALIDSIKMLDSDADHVVAIMEDKYREMSAKIESYEGKSTPDEHEYLSEVDFIPLIHPLIAILPSFCALTTVQSIVAADKCHVIYDGEITQGGQSAISSDSSPSLCTTYTSIIDDSVFLSYPWGKLKTSEAISTAKTKRNTFDMDELHIDAVEEEDDEDAAAFFGFIDAAPKKPKKPKEKKAPKPAKESVNEDLERHVRNVHNQVFFSYAVSIFKKLVRCLDLDKHLLDKVVRRKQMLTVTSNTPPRSSLSHLQLPPFMVQLQTLERLLFDRYSLHCASIKSVKKGVSKKEWTSVWECISPFCVGICPTFIKDPIQDGNPDSFFTVTSFCSFASVGWVASNAVPEISEEYPAFPSYSFPSFSLSSTLPAIFSLPYRWKPLHPSFFNAAFSLHMKSQGSEMSFYSIEAMEKSFLQLMETARSMETEIPLEGELPVFSQSSVQDDRSSDLHGLRFSVSMSGESLLRQLIRLKLPPISVITDLIEYVRLPEQVDALAVYILFKSNYLHNPSQINARVKQFEEYFRSYTPPSSISHLPHTSPFSSSPSPCAPLSHQYTLVSALSSMVDPFNLAITKSSGLSISQQHISELREKVHIGKTKLKKVERMISKLVKKRNAELDIPVKKGKIGKKERKRRRANLSHMDVEMAALMKLENQINVALRDDEAELQESVRKEGKQNELNLFPVLHLVGRMLLQIDIHGTFHPSQSVTIALCDELLGKYHVVERKMGWETSSSSRVRDLSCLFLSEVCNFNLFPPVHVLDVMNHNCTNFIRQALKEGKRERNTQHHTTHTKLLEKYLQCFISVLTKSGVSLIHNTRSSPQLSALLLSLIPCILHVQSSLHSHLISLTIQCLRACIHESVRSEKIIKGFISAKKEKMKTRMTKKLAIGVTKGFSLFASEASLLPRLNGFTASLGWFEQLLNQIQEERKREEEEETQKRLRRIREEEERLAAEEERQALETRLVQSAEDKPSMGMISVKSDRTKKPKQTKQVILFEEEDSEYSIEYEEKDSQSIITTLSATDMQEEEEEDEENEEKDLVYEWKSIFNEQKMSKKAKESKKGKKGKKLDETSEEIFQEDGLEPENYIQLLLQSLARPNAPKADVSEVLSILSALDFSKDSQIVTYERETIIEEIQPMSEEMEEGEEKEGIEVEFSQSRSPQKKETLSSVPKQGKTRIVIERGVVDIHAIILFFVLHPTQLKEYLLLPLSHLPSYPFSLSLLLSRIAETTLFLIILFTKNWGRFLVILENIGSYLLFNKLCSEWKIDGKRALFPFYKYESTSFPQLHSTVASSIASLASSFTSFSSSISPSFSSLLSLTDTLSSLNYHGLVGIESVLVCVGKLMSVTREVEGKSSHNPRSRTVKGTKNSQQKHESMCGLVKEAENQICQCVVSITKHFLPPPAVLSSAIDLLNEKTHDTEGRSIASITERHYNDSLIQGLFTEENTMERERVRLDNIFSNTKNSLVRECLLYRMKVELAKRKLYFCAALDSRVGDLSSPEKIDFSVLSKLEQDIALLATSQEKFVLLSRQLTEESSKSDSLTSEMERLDSSIRNMNRDMSRLTDPARKQLQAAEEECHRKFQPVNSKLKKHQSSITSLEGRVKTAHTKVLQSVTDAMYKFVIQNSDQLTRQALKEEKEHLSASSSKGKGKPRGKRKESKSKSKKKQPTLESLLKKPALNPIKAEFNKLFRQQEANLAEYFPGNSYSTWVRLSNELKEKHKAESTLRLQHVKLNRRYSEAKNKLKSWLKEHALEEEERENLADMISSSASRLSEIAKELPQIDKHVTILKSRRKEEESRMLDVSKRIKSCTLAPISSPSLALSPLSSLHLLSSLLYSLASSHVASFNAQRLVCANEGVLACAQILSKVEKKECQGTMTSVGGKRLVQAYSSFFSFIDDDGLPSDMFRPKLISVCKGGKWIVNQASGVLACAQILSKVEKKECQGTMTSVGGKRLVQAYSSFFSFIDDDGLPSDMFRPKLISVCKGGKWIVNQASVAKICESTSFLPSPEEKQETSTNIIRQGERGLFAKYLLKITAFNSRMAHNWHLQALLAASKDREEERIKETTMADKFDEDEGRLSALVCVSSASDESRVDTAMLKNKTVKQLLNKVKKEENKMVMLYGDSASIVNKK